MTQPAYILSEAQDLPPKPPAPPGRAVLWAWVMGAPGVVYKGKEMLVTPGVIDVLIGRYRLMCAQKYTPPLAALHPKEYHPVTSDGVAIPSKIAKLAALPAHLRKGDILDLRRHVVDGAESLIAAICPAMPAQDVHEAVDLGQLKYLSPGLGPVELDGGDVLQFALKELSIVPAPHQKRGLSHILGGEVSPEQWEADMTEPVTAEEMPEEGKGEEQVPSDADRIAALEARLEEMSIMMGDLKKMMEKGDDNDDEEPEEDKEPEAAQMSETSPVVSALQARIDQLEADKEAHSRALFAAHLPAGSVLTMVEGDAAWLYDLRKANPDVFATIRERLIVPEALAAPVTMAENPWRKVGSGEAPPVSSPATNNTDLLNACLSECDGDEAKGRALYLKRRQENML